jgi:hypothetical protein
MSHKREREQFITKVAQEGMPLDVALLILRAVKS